MSRQNPTVLLPAEMANEIRDEAQRQDRSISWIVQQALRIALPEFKKLRTIENKEAQ